MKLVALPSVLLLRCRGIRINWLQVELLCQFPFLALLRHQRPQIENQVPRLIGLDVIGKGRHGSTVQASHENPINILIGVTAFWPGSLGEVEGCNLSSEIILKS